MNRTVHHSPLIFAPFKKKIFDFFVNVKLKSTYPSGNTINSPCLFSWCLAYTNNFAGRGSGTLVNCWYHTIRIWQNRCCPGSARQGGGKVQFFKKVGQTSRESPLQLYPSPHKVDCLQKHGVLLPWVYLCRNYQPGVKSPSSWSSTHWNGPSCWHYTTQGCPQKRCSARKDRRLLSQTSMAQHGRQEKHRKAKLNLLKESCV